MCSRTNLFVNFVGKKRQNPFLSFVSEMRKVLQECEGEERRRLRSNARWAR